MTSTGDAPDPRARHASAAPRGTVADAPPVRIPALHFAAALLFLALGAVALIPAAPALAAGSFSDRSVIGAFHLLTLGWIGTAIMGASTQLVPVVLGAPLRWEGLIHTSFGAWVAGAVAFTGGMLAGIPAAYVFGAGALGAGALLFVGNLWATLPRAPERDLTWWCLAASGLFLVAGWVLGLLLAVNLTAGILGATRYSVLSVHVHLVAGGWVLLTMIGVGHRLLPRFLGSRGVSPLFVRAAAVLTGLGALLLVASEHILPVGVVRLGLWAMAVGAVAFAASGFLHYRSRGRRPGPAMALAGAGLGYLLLAAAAGGWLLVGGPPGAGRVTAYGLLLVPGAFALFVAGMASRIVPFLGAIHDAKSGRSLSFTAVALLAAGAATLGLAPLAGSGTLATAGAVAYAAGAILLALRLLPTAWRLAMSGSCLQSPPSASS